MEYFRLDIPSLDVFLYPLDSDVCSPGYCSWSLIFVSSLFIVVSSVAILASFVARCSVNCSSFVVSMSPVGIAIV